MNLHLPIMGGLGGETSGVLVKNLRTMKVVNRVNVSESSCSGSPGLSGIKDC